MRFTKHDLATLILVAQDVNVLQVSKERMRKEQDKHDMEDMSVLLGFYCPSTNTVYLRNDLDSATKGRTYWHEIAHAYSRNLIEGDFKRGELSEAQVERIATEVQKYLWGIGKHGE
jgi:hypothetical protein